MKDEIGKRKNFVEKTIYTLGKCIDYRRAVSNVFAYATDKARGENEPDVRPYAEQLRNKWSATISGHEIQIQSRTNAVDNCKEELQ